MPLKICFNNQTHKITKFPENFQSLQNIVNMIFNAQLPNNWTLQYVDSEGDSIMLSDEHDYTNLVEEETANSSRSVKVTVLPLEALKKKESEEFQLIEKS